MRDRGTGSTLLAFLPHSTWTRSRADRPRTLLGPGRATGKNMEKGLSG